MIKNLPGYNKNVDILKNWKLFYIEEHPIGERIIITWNGKGLKYFNSELSELDSLKYAKFSFPLKYALINSNIKGGWVFDTIFSDDICTVTDFDENSTLGSICGILEYKIRRHSLLTLFRFLPSKTSNIKICSSEEVAIGFKVKKKKNLNYIAKSQDSYSFCSTSNRVLLNFL